MGRFNVIDNNVIDKQGILNILKNFIFGNASVEIYDQNKTYNTADKAFIIDATTGDIKVVTARENNVTGPYNPEKWSDMTLADTIGSGLDDIVVISAIEPTNKITQLWLTPDEYSTHYITMPDEPVIPDEPDEPISTMSLIFTNSAIPIVEDADTSAELDSLDIGDIVLDWEGEGTMVVQGLTDIESDHEMLIDEQEDISVDEDKPDKTDPHLLWVDTDITDDI